VPILTAGFALVVTLFGLGSYWATVQISPGFRVPIERATWFVAVCACVAVMTAVGVGRALSRRDSGMSARLEWDWVRLRAVTALVFGLALVGTVVAIRRIGYIPILSGDPNELRAEFPDIGGMWYRFSMLGGVVAMLVGAQAAARRATPGQYLIGVASLGLVGLYGPRYFVVLPLGVSFLLWDRLRHRVRLTGGAVLILVSVPILAAVGYWREQNSNIAFLGPIGVFLYGALIEFRDLAWSLDYYSYGDRLLRGATLGSLIVPLLPSPVWALLGIDKVAIYNNNSATILAGVMGVQNQGERIGAFGEFFINFGWSGAIVGAVFYGMLVGYLDDRFLRSRPAEVRGVFLALVITTVIFAQIGQLNVFTSTLTGYGYPLALIAILASRRVTPTVAA
jgi:hypothetical protein